MTKTSKELTEYITNKAISLIRRVHGCTIGAKEFCGSSSERVDAILFNSYGSFMIEVKITRSDFLKDAKKPFRVTPRLGVGKYRYYACPEGLIKPEELPDGWGLIYVRGSNKKSTMPVGFGGVVYKDGVYTRSLRQALAN